VAGESLGRPDLVTCPSRAEVALLCAFLFFVPLFEVPKQLLWLAWTVAWVVSRARPGAVALRRVCLRNWSSTDLALAVFALSALAAGMFAGHWPRSAAEGLDTLRIVLVAAMVARGGYQLRQLVAACVAAIAGTMVTLAWAYAELLTASTPAFLELHSVGQVNHSAIYLAITLALAVGLLVAGWNTSGRTRVSLFAVTVVVCASLLVAASRAALVASLIFLVLLVVADPLRGDRSVAKDAAGQSGSVARRSMRPFAGLLMGIVLASAAAYGALQYLGQRPLQPSGEGFSEKFSSRPEQSGVLAFRDKIWRVGVLAFATHPVLGIGNTRFGALEAAQFCPRGEGSDADRAGSASLIDPCDSSKLYFTTHAHSVFVNALAERGALGVVALVWLLGEWARRLVAELARSCSDPVRAGLWSVSLGGWVVTVFVGVLNTTLHHEHGILAMFTMGVLLALSAQSRDVSMSSRRR